MLLQISTLTTEKRREEELRNYMQLERVAVCKPFSQESAVRNGPLMVSACTCLINKVHGPRPPS